MYLKKTQNFNSSKTAIGIFATLLVTFCLTACGDDSSSSSANDSATDNYDYVWNSESDAVQCQKDLKGKTAFYKPEESILICEYDEDFEEWTWIEHMDNPSDEENIASSSAKKESTQNSASSTATDKDSQNPSNENDATDDSSATEKTDENASTSVDLLANGSVRDCTPRTDSLGIEYNCITDSRDGQVYLTMTFNNDTWMAENLRFEYKVDGKLFQSECAGPDSINCGAAGRSYSWAAAMDSAGIFSNDGIGCGYNTPCYPYTYKKVRGICPEGWHIANMTFDGTTQQILKAFDKTFEISGYSSGRRYWFHTETDYTQAEYVYHTSNKIAPISYGSTKKTDYIPVRCIMNKPEGPNEYFDPEVTKEDFLNPNIDYGELKDSRDGKVYKTVKIGDQVWMAENLNYDLPRPTEKDSSKYSWCYADKDMYCDKMGRFYYYSGVYKGIEVDDMSKCLDNDIIGYCSTIADPPKTIQSICPDGWHLPSKTEWKTLVKAVGDVYDDLMAQDTRRNTNASGFSIILTGHTSILDVTYDVDFYLDFNDIGQSAIFWTSSTYTHEDFSKPVPVFAEFKDNFLFITEDFQGIGNIRCIKDAE